MRRKNLSCSHRFCFLKGEAEWTPSSSSPPRSLFLVRSTNHISHIGAEKREFSGIHLVIELKEGKKYLGVKKLMIIV